MLETRAASFNALALVTICLLISGRESVAAQQTAPEATSRMKQIISNLGVGTEVMIEIGYAEALRGVIRTIGDSAFEMEVRKPRSLRQVGYGTVSSLKLPKMKYKAGQSQDTAALRQIVSAVGVGKDVFVEPYGSEKFRATIQAIEVPGFTVSTAKGATFHLDFSRVRELRPAGPTRVAKAAIIGAAVGAGILVAIVVGAHYSQ